MNFLKQLLTPVLLLLVTLINTPCKGQKTEISLKKLTLEHLKNPIGIDIPKPRFSWQIHSSGQNVHQTAYQILVADTPHKLEDENGLIWNSQKVNSNQSINIPYSGRALKSREDYFWKVKVWTNKGKAVSPVQSWSMTFLKPGDWQAGWIGLDSLTNPGETLENWTRVAARYLRNEFEVKQGLRRAKLYISGLGLYECFLNGKKVGSDLLTPTLTDYAKRVNYNVYDVTGHLTEGKNNAIGVMLGNGRYVAMRNPTYEALSKKIGKFRHFGFPKLLLQLELDFADGEKKIITSNEHWKINTRGPIVANNEFDGEEYNAHYELQGWESPGYDDSGWRSVQMVEAPEGKLVAQRNPNLAVMEEVSPESIQEVKPGCYVIDMGQNMVGWLKINLKGKKDQPIKLRFAEIVSGDGTINTANYRTAKAECIYTPSKDGSFTWEPSFTYFGFRYVEVTGIDYEPQLSSFTGKVIYDRMETTGNFECSNEILNKIHKNAYWGIRGNYRSGPTDCPQRDEKLHWLGDRSMNCFGESFIFGNHLLYAKWVQDIADEQLESGCLSDIAPYYWYFDYSKYQETYFGDNVTWPSTFFFASEMLYEQFGDPRPIKRHYDSMAAWIEYMADKYLVDNILDKDQYGDWCVPPEDPYTIHSTDPDKKTGAAVLGTTYFYEILKLMARFAEISGQPEDRAGYLRKAEKIREAFIQKFFNEKTGQVDNNTVTANILALAFGMIPEGYEQKVMKRIHQKIVEEHDGHISTGLIGAQYLMRGLSDYGNPELAYRIATNTTYPSWGYMIENGATTIWELWNGNTADPVMNSHNHVMLLGDLIIWLYESLAGIKTDPEAVGFKKIIMNPVFIEDIDYVDAYHESPYGMIKSHWQKAGEAFSWEVSIPCNSEAFIHVPVEAINDFTINNQPPETIVGFRIIEETPEALIIRLGSGNYTINVGN